MSVSNRQHLAALDEHRAIIRRQEREIHDLRDALRGPRPAPAVPAKIEGCGCFACGDHLAVGGLVLPRRMHVCADCGNKRCPKATDHRNACTGSNEPGQAGSRYEGLS